MAQRKSVPTGKPGSGKPAGRSTTGKSGTSRSSGATANRPSGSRSAPSGANSRADNRQTDRRPPAATGARRQPPRKPGKSIVNQKQRPWGLIAATVAVVLFAAAIVVVVVATHKSSTSDSLTNASGCTQTVGTENATTPYLSENKCASEIKGVDFKQEPNRQHITSGTVVYDSTPPVGGNHSPYWADCTGTVYAQAIADENAVHMLEHGAIWVTYNPSTLSAAGLDKLKTYVQGVNYMALSPYPNLKTPISLQSWGYQLFLSSPSDSRIARFIKVLRLNEQTTPEYGATCSQPTFIEHPSTFGHPLFEPANGASGNTSGA